MQRGVYLVDDLLGIHADGMNGGDNDQQEQHEQNRVLAGVLAFFSPEICPKPTKHSRILIPAELSRKSLLKSSAPATSPGAVTAARIVGELGGAVHGTKVARVTEGRAREWHDRVMPRAEAM